MQVSKTTKFEERERHWRDIISRANAYPGSALAFGASEGITASNFYNWKKKLGAKKAWVSYHRLRRLKC